MSTGLVSPTEADRNASTVWDSIALIIQQRGLADGDQLPPIRELAEQLAVKHSVIRDALLRAETKGLVTIRPRMGAFLRSPQLSETAAPTTDDPIAAALSTTGHNLFHLLDARRLIEIELAGRAAERRQLEDLLPVRNALEGMLRWTPDVGPATYVDLDIRFHVEIARLAGNTTLLSLQQGLMELLRPHLVDVPRDATRQATTDQSHRRIYAALVRGDAEGARSAMRKHLSLAYDSLLQDMQEPPRSGRERSPGTRKTLSEKPRHGAAS
ncbi:MAG: FCD domain-containing protein [Planctomycetaceae bacterium]|nr:FCD domain-containing protein [Planctomycetaceae bacterium]